MYECFVLKHAFSGQIYAIHNPKNISMINYTIVWKEIKSESNTTKYYIGSRILQLWTTYFSSEACDVYTIQIPIYIERIHLSIRYNLFRWEIKYFQQIKITPNNYIGEIVCRHQEDTISSDTRNIRNSMHISAYSSYVFSLNRSICGYIYHLVTHYIPRKQKRAEVTTTK